MGLTPSQARDVLDEVLEAAGEVLSARGMRVSGQVRRCHPFDIELSLYINDPADRDRREAFIEHCQAFGLRSDDYGREFVWEGQTWQLIGLNTRAPRNPVEALMVPSGVSRRLSSQALWAVTQARRADR